VPGDPGSKTNFGFTVKYSKSGTPTGNINIVVRNNGRVYHVKSTAITSATATVGTPGKATIKAMVTIRDITDPGNPTTVTTTGALTKGTDCADVVGKVFPQVR
jgi:hypothetical protein